MTSDPQSAEALEAAALEALDEALAVIGAEHTAHFSVTIISTLQLYADAVDAKLLNACADGLCGLVRAPGGQERNDAASIERVRATIARGHSVDWSIWDEAHRLAQRDGLQPASHHRRLARKYQQKV
jgi:hypothetical protein